MSTLPDFLIEPIVRTALIEDLGLAGDRTALATTIEEDYAVAEFRARGDGVIAGLKAAKLAHTLFDPRVSVTLYAEDGDRVRAGQGVAQVAGPAASIVTIERTALNFLTHLSGVATLTRAFVEAVAGTKAKIAATRKTLPGLRALQKEAVRAAGGWPHRYGLYDAVLVKDNHIAFAGSVTAALERARERAGHLCPIEVEIDRLDQLEEALAAKPQAILLDNFSLEDLAEAVRLAAGRTMLEASGGVTLETVRAIAETGLDVISVGALTHSAPAFDIGLDAV